MQGMLFRFTTTSDYGVAKMFCKAWILILLSRNSDEAIKLSATYLDEKKQNEQIVLLDGDD
jgi:hypothetical protein